jgi:hypothetical protein
VEIKVNIPDGLSGNWRVETFTVSEQEASFNNIRSMFSFSSRPIKPGTYKRLMRNRTVVMSNTPSEIMDHLEFIRRAKRKGGHILINGLGLGVCLSAILESDNVGKVTVVEKSQDVINLVGPRFNDDHRVEIINSDCFNYKPPKGVSYTCVWHDIWDYICADNLPEMHKLHRKYGKKCEWQGSWARRKCERRR